jgi:hypothetical protein
MGTTNSTRFRVVVRRSGSRSRRVLEVLAPAPLAAALEAFGRISGSVVEVVDVATVSEAGRRGLTVAIEARSGERYRVLVEEVPAEERGPGVR